MLELLRVTGSRHVLGNSKHHPAPGSVQVKLSMRGRGKKSSFGICVTGPGSIEATAGGIRALLAHKEVSAGLRHAFQSPPCRPAEMRLWRRVPASGGDANPRHHSSPRGEEPAACTHSSRAAGLNSALAPLQQFVQPSLGSNSLWADHHAGCPRPQRGRHRLPSLQRSFVLYCPRWFSFSSAQLQAVAWVCPTAKETIEALIIKRSEHI